MTRPCFGALALSGLLHVASCGSVAYVGQSSARADAALEDARRQRADELAPYEFTMATAYDDKARQAASFSRFQVAVEYARRAEELAAKAAAVARSRGKRAGGGAGEKGTER